MKIFQLSLVIAIAFGFVGCTNFEPNRTSRYVDESNNYVTVEYGKIDKPHKSVFVLPNGNTWNFESTEAVRVYLPDDDDFFAHRHMSEVGTLYVSDDEEWELLERGPNCILARKVPNGKGYRACYRGNLCGTQRINREDKDSGSHSHTTGTLESNDKRLKRK